MDMGSAGNSDANHLKLPSALDATLHREVRYGDAGFE